MLSSWWFRPFGNQVNGLKKLSMQGHSCYVVSGFLIAAHALNQHAEGIWLLPL